MKIDTKTLGLFFFCLSFNVCAQDAIPIESNWDKVFKAFETRGTLVVLDDRGDTHQHDPQQEKEDGGSRLVEPRLSHSLLELILLLFLPDAAACPAIDLGLRLGRRRRDLGLCDGGDRLSRFDVTGACQIAEALVYPVRSTAD